MKKKTKITLIVSSAAVILLAGVCVIRGTYALFTSEDKVNIAVKSGTVNVVAIVDEFTTWSGEANSLTGVPADDEIHIQKTLPQGTFVNGGTGAYSVSNGEGKIELKKMTPGDRVTFKLSITNNSNIAIKYRILFSKGDGDNTLYDALEMKFGDLKTGDGEATKTEWALISRPNETGQAIGDSLDCSITLPTDKLSEDYGDKECSVILKVEAVQGNYIPVDD